MTPSHRARYDLNIWWKGESLCAHLIRKGKCVCMYELHLKYNTVVIYKNKGKKNRLELYIIEENVRVRRVRVRE